MGWMRKGIEARGYAARAAMLLGGFALLPGALLALAAAREDPFAARRLVFLIVPGMVAALLAAIRRLRPTRPARFSWRQVGWGAAATILLAGTVSYAGGAINRARARARSAETRALLATLPAVPAGAPFPKIFFQKGVSFTAEYPDVYASPGARRMLEALPAYGVNAIALVPYGGTSARPPRVYRYGPGSWESDEGLEVLARLAHARGIRVLLKPAIWRANDLEISSAQDRAAWFREYGDWIEQYARLAARLHADLFSVGGEFVHLSSDGAPWRAIIARVRRVYAGPLTYAANFGSEFEGIAFWDALDYLGLQEYYPLPDDLATDEIVRRVEAVQRRYQRPVIFTEVGFSSAAGANRRPWEDGRGAPAPEFQARCYQAVFQAFYSKPWFEGMYWWKVGTNGYGGPDDSSLTPWAKPAMQVLSRWYLKGGR